MKIPNWLPSHTVVMEADNYHHRLEPFKSFLRVRGIDDNKTDRMLLAIREVIDNVRRHGYGEGNYGTVTVKLSVNRQDKVATALIRDKAPAVTIDLKAEVKRTRRLTSLEAAGGEGSFGLLFIHTYSDRVVRLYERDGDVNITELEWVLP